jgi:uncharacterized membrane protein YvbJ
LAKIKCAQCGAANQDVTEADACWKCGAPLAGGGKASIESVTHAESTIENTVRQEQSGPSRLDRYYEKPPAPNRAPLVIGIAVVLLIILVVALVLSLGHQH